MAGKEKEPHEDEKSDVKGKSLSKIYSFFFCFVRKVHSLFWLTSRKRETNPSECVGVQIAVC